MSGTVTVTLAGRDVEFRPPTDAQMLVVHRILARAQQQMDESGSDRVPQETIGQIAKIMDVLDSMVAVPADRQFLESKILDRTVDFQELFDAFRVASNEPDDSPVTKKVPAKKATRGRARRAG